jgi:hypothetical protein
VKECFGISEKILVLTLMFMFLSANRKVEASWTDGVEIKGDFRYRHEMIDKEGSDIRNRQRIRARLALSGAVNDAISLKFQLASGSTDPVSTNQTLDDGLTKKAVWIDLAYFDWKILQSVNVFGGKMKNPFYTPGKTDLIWDGDLTPEGIALAFNAGTETLKVFGSAGGFWVDERSSDSDSILEGFQTGVKLSFAGGQTQVMLGGSYYTYTEAAGYKPFYDTGNSFGNSLDADGNYLYDYNLVEGFMEIEMKFGKLPVSIHGDYVNNGDPDENNTGYLVGLAIGAIKDPWSWQFSYNYRSLEKNAVLGAYTDSDFCGGGTNGEGHKLGFGLQIAKNTGAAITYFKDQIDPDGTDIGYDRLQIDVNFKF